MPNGQDKQTQLYNQKIKENWVQALNEFTSQVKKWLSKHSQTGLLSIEEQFIEKEEEHIGRYVAPMLIIAEANNIIEIRPVGRFAIGAIGRVDMTGGGCSFAFLYSKTKGWIYMGNRKPLSEELFHELLTQITIKQQIH